LLRLGPQLVLISSHTPRLTRARLQEQGLRVEELAAASSLTDIRANLTRMGEWLATPERAQRLINGFDRRIAQVTADRPTTRPSALFLQPNGYTSGQGTLQDEALRLAGWRNLAAEAGINGYAPIDLEQLINLAPDAIFTSSRSDDRNALALRILDHPALHKLGNRHAPHYIDYRYWICGGPMLADAIELLARQRRQLQRARELSGDQAPRPGLPERPASSPS
jgi:iron complex transport system substrate-binding protein